MRKRILFVFPSYSIGGTTVSTRNLISLLAKEGYDCFAMPLYERGPLFQLYEDVKRIDTPFAIRVLGKGAWHNEKSFISIIPAFLYRIISNNFTWLKHVMVNSAFDKVVKKFDFDTIVACQEGIATEIVSYSHFGSKIAWVRCDYKRWLDDTHKHREDYYTSFKSIVCVAEQACANFKVIYPEFISKTYCIPNPQDGELIINLSKVVEDDNRFYKDGNTLVSIGRLDAVKRFDQIAPIARKLKDRGIRFRWYLIGDGDERQRISDSIFENGVSDCVVMLGNKSNPYFYLSQADVLVCLSRSEACPRVVNEAKILHVPTVSSDFPTIYEFIQNEETGLIARLEDLPSAICRLFIDKGLYNRIQNNINVFTFDNKPLISQIKVLL